MHHQMMTKRDNTHYRYRNSRSRVSQMIHEPSFSRLRRDGYIYWHRYRHFGILSSINNFVKDLFSDNLSDVRSFRGFLLPSLAPEKVTEVAEIARTFLSRVETRGDKNTDRKLTTDTSRWVFTARFAPSSERPQFGMPRASIAARSRAAGSITISRRASCCCHRGKLQNVSPPSVLFESSRIFFTLHRRHSRKK